MTTVVAQRGVDAGGGLDGLVRSSDVSRYTRAAADRALAAEIRTAHAASRGRYGRPCVHAELPAHGRRVGPNRIASTDAGDGPVGEAQAAVPAHNRQRACLPDCPCISSLDLITRPRP